MPKRRRIEPRLAKPFDAAMKELVGLDPATWLAHFGVPRAGPVTILTTDLASTVLAEADQVLRVDGATPWLVQMEFQSSRDLTLARRLNLYSTLLERRYALPVQSLVMLLRPDADTLELTGRHEWRLPDGRRYRTFEYQVTRVWEQSTEAVLAGPLATLPLAPLSAGAEAEAASVLRRIEERVVREASPAAAERLRAGTYLLLGLRYPQDVINDLLRGVGTMAEALKVSSTYQTILAEGRAEGRAEEARRLLLQLGSQRLGPPDAGTRAAIDRLSDPEQLERAAGRLFEATNWEDLGLITSN